MNPESFNTKGFDLSINFMDRPFGDLYETLRGIYFSDIFNLGGEILKIKSRLATFPKDAQV